jgi:hypothetical protein
VKLRWKDCKFESSLGNIVRPHLKLKKRREGRKEGGRECGREKEKKGGKKRGREGGKEKNKSGDYFRQYSCPKSKQQVHPSGSFQLPHFIHHAWRFWASEVPSG